MFDEKQYKQYIETANFWVDIGERINNCIEYLSNDTERNTNFIEYLSNYTKRDTNFIEMVILALRSAEKMCIYRVNTLEEKVFAWEILFGEDSK